MNDVETVKQCLKVILEKGDIYDTIAVRENVKVLRHSFFRNHILLFSRILYGGVRIYEKIKSYFSPIEEIKQAQDTIRQILGVNVDIVRSKHYFDFYGDLANGSSEETLKDIKKKYERSKHPILSIFYEGSNVKIEEYVEHLKKISTFCNLYKIEEILLSEGSILGIFPDLDLAEYSHITMKQLLDYDAIQVPTKENEIEDQKYPSYDVYDTFDSYLLVLNRKELESLIQKLEIIKVSKKTVFELGRKLEDISVKNAISEFCETGDLEKLKEIVSSRLTLLINGDNSYKDKLQGKIFQNVTIKGDYIKILSTNQKGENSGSIVLTLYDYLEVPDYREILKKIKLRDDEHELFTLSALHLYLNQSMQINKSSQKDKISFYDYIYYTFQAKKEGRVKRIPGMYTKSDKRYKSFTHAFSSIILTILLAAAVMFTGLSFNFIEQVAFGRDDRDILTNMAETILMPYMKSFEYEKNIFDRFFQFTEIVTDDIANFFNAVNGDYKEGSLKSDKVIATIENKSNVDLPTYFATGYATGGSYHNGYMSFSINQPLISISDFRNVPTLFEISFDVNTNILLGCIQNDQLNFPKLFYPLGNDSSTINYVLTGLSIYDADDESKIITVDFTRIFQYGNSITDSEKSLLVTMQRPRLIYSYGIDYGINPFVSNLQKDNSYTESLPSEIRKSITKGLGLSEFASDSQIYSAILEKDYSLTPIKDAGLSWSIKWKNEKEYFETIASLDSLICNLAATLAVGVDEDLIYTIGYYSDDNDIRENEAHAWALSKDGILVDITPSSDIELEIEEKLTISMIVEWCSNHNIPLMVALTFAGYSIYKLFGKKIQFYLNIKRIENILENENIEESYAKLKSILYGGTNLPCERTNIQFLETVEREFGSFTIQDLKSLREKLIQEDDESLSISLALLKEVPFLKENKEKVKKMLLKKNKKL